AEGALGPLSHFHFRSNRGSSERYVSWGAPWMLDPASAGGGCLRNIGLHGVDMFLHLVGEDVEVVAAQTSARALGRAVEDYAVVLLRSASGVLGTVEVGNTYPAQGADGEWKLSGRNGLLLSQGGGVNLVDAAGERALGTAPPIQLSVVALRDALERVRTKRPPVADLRDCWRAMRVVDRAYALA
ncbi:MAG: Gfo/Idh/MocA family oxidoreductase, partial [Variibacter sp.]|nr:Gfo/Idh/MocA family oxidoreductase [Variibacter sp.]